MKPPLSFLFNSLPHFVLLGAAGHQVHPGAIQPDQSLSETPRQDREDHPQPAGGGPGHLLGGLTDCLEGV